MPMNVRRARTPLSAIMAAGLALAGCATNPDGTTSNIFSDFGSAFGSSDEVALTPEQQALREQEREYSRTRLTSAAAGAGIGALIGAAIGAASGGGAQRVATGAAIGAGVGGTAGYVGGTYLTRDHGRFVASRDSLQADIDAAREDTQRMQRNVQVAEGALTSQRAEIDRLNADLRAGRVSEDEARQKANNAAADVRAVRALAEESERRAQNLQQTIAAYNQAGVSTAELRGEAQRQQQQARRLREIERNMINVIDRTPANVRPVV